MHSKSGVLHSFSLDLLLLLKAEMTVLVALFPPNGSSAEDFWVMFRKYHTYGGQRHDDNDDNNNSILPFWGQTSQAAPFHHVFERCFNV